METSLVIVTEPTPFGGTAWGLRFSVVTAASSDAGTRVQSVMVLKNVGTAPYCEWLGLLDGTVFCVNFDSGTSFVSRADDHIMVGRDSNALPHADPIYPDTFMSLPLELALERLGDALEQALEAGFEFAGDADIADE